MISTGTTLAAIPETYYTAFGSLQQLRIAPQDRVLVRGAGSGVGVAFAQLLKAQFPHIVLHGSTRNPAKAARLQAVGFDEVITEADGKIQTDQSYDKILELVGTPTLLKRLDFPKDLQDLAQNYPLSGLIDPKLKRIWQWQINAEQRFIPNRAIFFASDVQSELQSALAGRTCSYLINSVCDPYLENGQLVELFPEIEKQKWQLYLYRPYQTIVAERVIWVYNKLKEILLAKMVKA